MEKILYNDKIINRVNKIDIEDRGYQFGDGVYEVIGVYDTKPLLMAEHMVRLERSAREVRLELPYSTSELEQKLTKLIAVNNLKEGIIYLQVSRGVASREHYFPDSSTTPTMVAYTREEKRNPDLEDNGGHAILTEDIRWLRCDIKTLNLLPNVLAKQAAKENHAVEAIFHRGDVVTEASSSNVFMVKNEELFTHPANNFILNGITRRKIITLCDDLGIKVNETTYHVDDLLQADEVFVSATKSDVIPILTIDETTIGDGTPGKVTKQILQAFRALYKNSVKNS